MKNINNILTKMDNLRIDLDLDRMFFEGDIKVLIHQRIEAAVKAAHAEKYPSKEFESLINGYCTNTKRNRLQSLSHIACLVSGMTDLVYNEECTIKTYRSLRPST